MKTRSALLRALRPSSSGTTSLSRCRGKWISALQRLHSTIPSAGGGNEEIGSARFDRRFDCTATTVDRIGRMRPAKFDKPNQMKSQSDRYSLEIPISPACSLMFGSDLSQIVKTAGMEDALVPADLNIQLLFRSGDDRLTLMR